MGSEYIPKPQYDYLRLFLDSRQVIGCSPSTIVFYRERLGKFAASVPAYWKATRKEVSGYLGAIPPNHNGLSTRHCSYRALRTFYRWLNTEYGLPNPMTGLRAPILGKPILPTLTSEQVQELMGAAETVRDKAIIALFTESGLRLSELSRVKAADIDWQAKTIRTIGKGRKEAYAPFGNLSAAYLKEWLSEYTPNGNVWGLDYWGITQMLKRLEARTGLKCNPHVFRRTFAVLLRKAGVDCLTIRDLGRWESVQMVERYTRSFGFADAMRFYRGPLGDHQPGHAPEVP